MILGAYNGNAQVLKTTQEAQFDTTYGYFNKEKKIPVPTKTINLEVPTNTQWVKSFDTWENSSKYESAFITNDLKFNKEDFVKINDTLFIVRYKFIVKSIDNISDFILTFNWNNGVKNKANEQNIVAYYENSTNIIRLINTKNKTILPAKKCNLIVEYYLDKIENLDEKYLIFEKYGIKKYIALNQSKKKAITLPACFVDVSCLDGYCVQNESNSILKICGLGTSGGSGILINNLNGNNKKYILTANHIFNGVSDVSSSIFEFNYKSTICDSTTLLPTNYTNIYVGKQILCRDSITDFALFELDDDPAMDNTQLTYAGWSRDTLLTAFNYCISHPMDAILTNPQLLAHHLPLIH